MRSAFSFAPEAKTADGGKGLKIGEVSKLSGVGIEALRFYEKSGLLERPERTYSGYRMYDESVLERLSFIKKAQVLGFTPWVERRAPLRWTAATVRRRRDPLHVLGGRNGSRDRRTAPASGAAGAA